MILLPLTQFSHHGIVTLVACMLVCVCMCVSKIAFGFQTITEEQIYLHILGPWIEKRESLPGLFLALFQIHYGHQAAAALDFDFQMAKGFSITIDGLFVM